MIKKDILLFISDKKTVLVIAVLMMLGIAGIFLSNGETAPTRINVGVVDLEQSNRSEMVKTYFTRNEDFNSFINVTEGTEEEIEEIFGRGELDFYFVIPENFTDEMIRMKNTPLTAVVNSEDKAKAAIYGALLESYSEYITSVEVNVESLTFAMREAGYDSSLIRDTNNSISWDLVFTALGKDAFFNRVPYDRMESLSLTDHYIYSVLVLLVLYAGMLTGYAVLLERKSGVRARLVTCGISPARQIVSKVIVYGTLMTAVFLIVTYMMNIFGKLVFSFGAGLYLTFMIYGSCIGFSIIALLIRSRNGYCFFSNMAILLMTVLGGGIVPVMYLPNALSSFAKFMPAYRFVTFILQRS
ncbi:MAG: ABC transporter permease [Lachnospiraceae bacterium]|nr:ABC transporter permease [Lachnospiraceae bacterium]